MAMCRVALAALALCGAGWARGAGPRPLGAWFAGYDRLTFDGEISWVGDHYLVSWYGSQFHNPFRTADLPRYSAVFFGSASNALVAHEQKALGEWVAAGGNLLVSGEAGPRLFGDRPPGWLGLTGWRSSDRAEAAAIEKPAHALARGLDRLRLPERVWAMTSVALAGPRAVTVLGRGELALLAVAEHGKGKVVFVGGALAPAARPTYLEKTLARDLPPLAARVWQNLLEYLDVPRRSDIIRDWASRAAVARGAPAVLWWRHQKETPLGAKLYFPPHPLPGDEATVNDRTLDVGRGDRHRQAFFLTSLREQTLTAEVADLRCGDDRIPADHVRLFVQEQPLPGYPFASYWLVPVRGPLPLKAHQSYTFWLTLDSGDARPGAYEGAVALRLAPGDMALSLPLRVKGYDVPPNDPDLLHFELEHCWFTMPGGYWIEKDQKRTVALSLDGKKLIDVPFNNPAHLGNYVRALSELEVDFGQSWGDVDRLYTLERLRLREGGKLLAEEIDKHPERFRTGALPHLDFSALDPVFDQAVAAGMRHFAMNYSLATDGTLSLARRITGEPSLAAESAPHQRVRTWYWSEYARYVRERGLLGTYTKIHDEFGPKEVPAFIGSARAIRPAGFKTYTTTYNFNRDAAAVRQIAPHLDLWQLGWDSKPRERFGPLGIHPEVWGTTASSYWGNSLDYGRAAGWAAARLGYQGLHTHGYMRWHWNDHEGCLPGPDGPFQTVTVTAYAQGVTEGRRLAQLYRLLDAARRRKDTAKLADDIERELHAKVVGFEPRCLVQLRDQPGIPGGGFPEYWYPDVCLSPAVYDRARARVLQMIAELRRALRPAPTLHYGELVLVENGKPVADLVGDAGAAATLAEAVKARTGATLLSGDEGRRAAIILGTAKDDAVRRLAGRELPGEITTTYPRPDGYAIRLVPATAERAARLLVVGGDAAGLRLGVRQLVHLLTAQEW